MTKIVASIEARMGSSRLPGKVMLDIEGKPAIGRLIERLSKSKLINDLIIATTTNVKDDILWTSLRFYKKWIRLQSS